MLLIDELENEYYKTTLFVDFCDIENFNVQLSIAIIEEYVRVYPYLNDAVSNILWEKMKLSNTNDPEKFMKKHRFIKRQCFVSFYNVPTYHELNSLNSTHFGTLIRVRAQVVQVNPVQPELSIGQFQCFECMHLIKNIHFENQFLNPLLICMACNNRRKFKLEIDQSTFMDFQKVKVQPIQSASHGSNVRRTYDVFIREDLVDTFQAGSIIEITGTMLVIRDYTKKNDQGIGVEVMKNIRHQPGTLSLQGVTIKNNNANVHMEHRSYIFASNVVAETDFTQSPTLNLCDKMDELHISDENLVLIRNDENLISNILNAIFPTIYQHENIKLSLLLQLIGGVKKKTNKGNLKKKTRVPKNTISDNINIWCPNTYYVP